MTKRIDSPDTEADVMLRACLDKFPRTSFNMIAGAGSGKTTSLVKALSHIVVSKGDALRRRGQKVACITYTEIAAKEIWNDVENDSLIHVSTIHSFLWTVIRSFQKDIKKWVIQRIAEKQDEIQAKIDNPRTRTPLEILNKQLKKLDVHVSKIESIQYFTYGTGSNYSKGILGHDDVIKLATSMIEDYKMLGVIVSQKYPYIFVDESQDTFPIIVSSLKKIDQLHSEVFCLGFFGDPMQKIFPTGAGEIPSEENWETITKPENFRCSQQVLKTINQIRKPADGLEQIRGRFENGKPVEGSSNLFILPINDSRTENVKKVQKWASRLFNDNHWISDDIKILVIVHRMAAIRLGFPNLYAAMNDDAPQSFKDGLLDGSAWPLRPFLSFILPLVEYSKLNANFDIFSILREKCPKLSSGNQKGVQLRETLAGLKIATEKIIEGMKENSSQTVYDILKLIEKEELIVMDDRVISHLNGTFGDDQEEEDNLTIEKEAMQRFFKCSANEFLGYRKYCDNESPFATQQGIKGAEFDKVITILDDDESSHIHFSYNKYFGIEELSDRDKENIKEGKDNVIARTRRLFYVSCSRARKDLIVIYFASDVDLAKDLIISTNIFMKENIYTVKDLIND
ncbi:UvrD-helicase domain-containing protein [Sphingobacterium siyangense]|uniref:UvrD-helicase domain-containing protein n=1 Tax=Sphingobacterium siyangense TaxID=459529 RepID=UPI0019656DAD|nr:UvrD-helicase domain-containing protein [Sphingobacterium siyangense]QRY55860.1 ATP-dependent helicase [Sphingobacterium siyangense]